jgi:hypothetical protein
LAADHLTITGTMAGHSAMLCHTASPAWAVAGVPTLRISVVKPVEHREANDPASLLVGC